MRKALVVMLVVVAWTAFVVPAPAQAAVNACFEYACTCGGACSFDAGCSSGDIAQYVWTWGDGTYGGGQIAYHTYSSSGQYTVRLVVTNGYQAWQPEFELDFVDQTITIGCK